MKRSAYLCSLKLPNNFVSFIWEIGYSLIYLDAWGMIKKHFVLSTKAFSLISFQNNSAMYLVHYLIICFWQMIPVSRHSINFGL